MRACATSRLGLSYRDSRCGNIKTRSPIWLAAFVLKLSGDQSADCAASTSAPADSNADARKLERTDAEVHFDLGEASPDPEKFEPQEFSIVWEGSVLAPIRATTNSWCGPNTRRGYTSTTSKCRSIDAWVKSGDDTEHRGEIRLLGGRAYPIKLEFSRGKQGVNDKDKNKKGLQAEREYFDLARMEAAESHAGSDPVAESCRLRKSPEVFVLANAVSAG